MASKACWKNCESMLCSRLRIMHCSRVIPIPVRSLALLQLIKRHPFNRQQICNQKKGRWTYLDGCRWPQKCFTRGNTITSFPRRKKTWKRGWENAGPVPLVLNKKLNYQLMVDMIIADSLRLRLTKQTHYIYLSSTTLKPKWKMWQFVILRPFSIKMNRKYYLNTKA